MSIEDIGENNITVSLGTSDNLNYCMACVCSLYNGHADWLILGHYSHVMSTDLLRTRKTKVKIHKSNNVLNLERFSIYDSEVNTRRFQLMIGYN